MIEDPRAIVAREPMRVAQIVAVGMCVLLNALDGFDVLSSSFAAPGIAREWGINRAALGIVLSMELIGMAVGSVLFGVAADRYGRRPVMLLALIVMAAGMFLAGSAQDVTMLSVYRLFTGLGIGAMLSTTNAAVAEFSNARSRNMAVGIMAAGYPVGAIVGGWVVSSLFAQGHDWRVVFHFGGIVTAVFLPLVWLFVPETVAFLAHRRPADAVARINRTLRRMAKPTISDLPPVEPAAGRVSFVDLFAPGMARTTILMTVAYFAHIMTFYFILKWAAKIVSDMGFPDSQAGGVIVAANIGGFLGGMALSVASRWINVRALVIGAMLASTAMVAWFGQPHGDLHTLSIVAAIAGFCTNAAVVGIYAMLAQAFPTALRAGGTGFAIGLGRGGAALSPIVAGLLFQAGHTLPVVAGLMAAGSLVGVGALLMVRYREDQAAA